MTYWTPVIAAGNLVFYDGASMFAT